MSQELTIDLGLGQSQTGLALRAQLYDTAGAAVGSLVSTGFTEFGLGTYAWHYASYPDGFEGSVVFTVSGAPTLPKAAAGLNNADFGVTTAPSAATIATAVWASGTRTLTSFGTLVADTTTAVWAAGSRTLTSFGTLVADVTTAVWAAGSRTLTSFGTLVADVTTAVWAAGTRTLTSALALGPTDLAAIAASVWASITRTLTSSASQTAADLAGDDLAILRGDTWDESLTALGVLTGRSKLWFTVKVSEQDADSAAILQIEESAGLVYFNGAAATAGDGSLTVTNATTGALTLHLIAARTAELTPSTQLYYDCQVKIGSQVSTLLSGKVEIHADITRSLS